ncbi:D-arabinono-1,4-lactone oxidase [Aureococcus anophagefferens]|nr:D-arabinono-1,4-lactone oxidase [Aureococcus anophagefferens]
MLARAARRLKARVPWASAAAALGASASCALADGGDDDDDDVLEVVNWSATHSARPTAVYTPESVADVEALVAAHAARKARLRPCGSALSPNGLALSAVLSDGGAMVNLGLLDDVVAVDAEARTVTVRCGAKVDQVLDALAPHGLTLENLASIASQQIGGFVGVGAHGTGASLPPVDEHVLELTVVTPGGGTVTLARGDGLLESFLVGLGALGVAVEAKLRCVPKHLLRERVQVMTRNEVAAKHADLLRDNRHVRFMWIPFEDAVVVVSNNPTFDGVLGEGQGGPSPYTDDQKLAPLRALLEATRPGVPGAASMHSAELRDALLAIAPLDVGHVRAVNKAEAEFWRRSQGTDVADSSRKLNFECGGQQWVNECCFPAGSLSQPSGADRWTSGSRSLLSPASSKAPLPDDAIFSWVGVIMYLPTDEPTQRAAITAAFDGYKKHCERSLWPAYGAVEHWAKIEEPADADAAATAVARLAAKFDTAKFAALRDVYDPDNILSTPLLDAVLPRGG